MIAEAGSAAVVIRDALLSDSAALSALSGELGYPMDAAEMERRLTAVAEQRGDIVKLAVCDGAVAGWIHGSVVPSLETGTYGEIRALVVSEAVRSRGIGARLVAALEEWAAASGCLKVRVRSKVERGRARKFYERLGYQVTKTQNVFDKPLPL